MRSMLQVQLRIWIRKEELQVWLEEVPEPCRNRSYLAPVTPPPRQEGQHKWLKPKQVVMHETTSYRHYTGAASMSGDVFYALHINC